MDSPERGALLLVRLIGALFLLWTIFELGLYLASCLNPKHRLPIEPLPVLLRATPAVIGTLILTKARAMAEWLSNILE
jgi:hypothetical protein